MASSIRTEPSGRADPAPLTATAARRGALGSC
jgi:hypothetical protein